MYNKIIDLVYYSGDQLSQTDRTFLKNVTCCTRSNFYQTLHSTLVSSSCKNSIGKWNHYFLVFQSCNLHDWLLHQCQHWKISDMKQWKMVNRQFYGTKLSSMRWSIYQFTSEFSENLGFLSQWQMFEISRKHSFALIYKPTIVQLFIFDI